MSEVELDRLLDTWEAPAPPPSLRRGLVAAFPERRRRIFGMPLRWALATAGIALCTVFGGAVGAGSFDSPELGRFYGQYDTGTGSLYVHTVRMISPPASPFKHFALGTGVGGNVMGGVSYVYGLSGGACAGYEYALELLAGGQFRVSLTPMSLAGLKERLGPRKMNGQIAFPPGLPATRTVQAGEPYEVTLWESGGERIYERTVYSWTPPPGWPGIPGRPAAREGGMLLTGAQLYVNGQLAASQPSAGFGPVIWVRLPGQGRFLAALDPQGNPRFTQAGHVNGKLMEFQSGGAQFRITCAEPITTGGDHPLYVYHQQSFENMLDQSHPMAQKAFMGNAGPANLHQE